jgi:superfamily II RNA helicase
MYLHLNLILMFKNLFKKQDNYDNLTEIIDFSINAYIENYEDMVDTEEETDLVYNLIFSKVKNELLAYQLLVFIPMAFTREYCKKYADKLSGFYSRSLEDGNSEKVNFMDNPVYMSILKVVKPRIQRMNSDDIFKILEWSSEFRIIEYVEQNGITLDSISPPATGNI